MATDMATTDEQRAKAIAEHIFAGCLPTDTAKGLSAVLADRLAREFAAVRADAAARNPLGDPVFAAGLAATLKAECETQHARAEAALARVETLEQALREIATMQHHCCHLADDTCARLARETLGASHVP